MQIHHVKEVRDPAHAPYNFVPLNDKIVTIPRNELPPSIPMNVYHADRKTGWIELRIKTRTPMYIRDTNTEEEEKSDKPNADFYSPGGTLRIPGSSLRGLTRTMVEILSFGRFGAYNDSRLYYRGLADKSNLRREYQDHMSSYDRGAKKANYKMSAGFLRRKDSFDYEIIPAAEGFRQIPKHIARKKVQEAPGDEEYNEFNFYRIDEDFLVVSGNMQNKKKDWIIPDIELPEKAMTIPEKDVDAYQDDSTRADKVPNLIKLADRLAKDPRAKVPCFYSKWQDSEGNQRVSFGHTAMFRLAYQKSIKEHLPRIHWRPQEDDGISPVDFAEAIFGNETSFAGRVFFEDAILELKPGQTADDVKMREGSPKILSTPKPTTFQHYLVQSGDNNRQLNHYNSNAAIRGNKLYWHKSGKHWEETDQKTIEEHSTQYTKIRPVKPDTTFVGRARFENLSEKELGALLFALDLNFPQEPETEYCHKLGMGKPLGLGSVKITPTVRISQRRERYETLFGEIEPSKLPTEKIEALKETFSGYVCEELGFTPQKTLWDHERLQELKTMLNFTLGQKWERRNSYMTIQPKNEFKFRNVLPLPSKV